MEAVCNLLQILKIYQTLHQKSTQDLLRQTSAASACMFTYLDILEDITMLDLFYSCCSFPCFVFFFFAYLFPILVFLGFLFCFSSALMHDDFFILLPVHPESNSGEQYDPNANFKDEVVVFYNSFYIICACFKTQE